MKFASLFFGLAFYSLAYGSLESSLEELKKERQKAYETYKTSNPDWNKLPNEEHQAFFTKWANQNLEEELKLHADHCKQDEKLCLSEKDKSALEAQYRVAVKVVELRNQYAKTNPTKEEQEKVNKDIDRAANVSLCHQHNKNCASLAQKELDLVEALKQRDAQIQGMEAEFAIKIPEWKDKKADKEVKDFMLRRENEILNLNLKLNDRLCHKYPKDTEFCLEDAQIEELRADTLKMNCQHERIHQLYNLTKDEMSSKEKILVAGHNAQWESLEKKDCKYLLAQDRVGESIAPPVVVAPKEEVFGENEDEKSVKNYNPESCQWVSDMPRKISYMPGCGSRGACLGYVVCDRKEGEGKFVRMSTCAPTFCGGSQSDAVRCTKQGGYYTRKAKDESKEFVSEKLKRIFSTGVIKQ